MKIKIVFLITGLLSMVAIFNTKLITQNINTNELSLLQVAYAQWLPGEEDEDEWCAPFCNDDGSSTGSPVGPDYGVGVDQVTDCQICETCGYAAWNIRTVTLIDCVTGPGQCKDTYCD